MLQRCWDLLFALLLLLCTLPSAVLAPSELRRLCLPRFAYKRAGKRVLRNALSDRSTIGEFEFEHAFEAYERLIDIVSNADKRR